MKFLLRLLLALIFAPFIILILIFLIAQIPLEDDKQKEISAIDGLIIDMKGQSLYINLSISAGAEAPLVVIFAEKTPSPGITTEEIRDVMTQAIEDLTSHLDFSTVLLERKVTEQPPSFLNAVKSIFCDEYADALNSSRFETIDAYSYEYTIQLKFANYLWSVSNSPIFENWVLDLIEARNKKLASTIKERIIEKGENKIVLILPSEYIKARNGIQSNFREMGISFIITWPQEDDFYSDDYYSTE